MKTKKLAIALLAGALALFALAGCQGTQGGAVELAGIWQLESIEDEHEGVAMTADEVKSLAEMLDMTVTLNLRDSGEAVLDMFGDVMTGTWTQEDDGTAQLTITDYGEAINQSIADGVELSEGEKMQGTALVIEGQNLKIAIDETTYVFASAE